MRKYVTLFKTSIIEVIAEKETIFIWSIGNAMSMIGILSVWLASGQDTIGDFSREELISYYLFMFIIQQIIGWWVYWSVRDAIYNGSLSNYILKPVSFVKYVILHEAAYKLISMITQLFVAAFLIIALRNHLTFHLDITMLFQLIPLLLIAICINFLTHFFLGCFTFYWTESYFVSSIHMIISMAFNGSIVPLSFYPESVHNIIKYNPFRFTFSFPSELVFNKLGSREYLSGIIVGTGWTILFGILAMWLWKKGLKKYAAWGN